MSRHERFGAFLLVWCALATTGVEAHVKLRFSWEGNGPSWPIRNAPSAQSDGAFSTSGPCGGNAAWGANGFTSISNGANVSLYISYNGGHQSANNLFHVAFACDQDGSTLVQNAFRDGQHTVATCATVAAPESNVNPPYHMVCELPRVDSTSQDDQFCTIAVVEQRNWGGCYDVKVTPDAPPDEIDSTSKLSTSYLAFQSINTAPPDTSCCNFTSATLNVGSLSNGRVTVKAGGTTDCANFSTWESEFTLTQDEFEYLNSETTGTRYVNSNVALNQETFEFNLVNSVLTSSNQRGGTESPIMCDHVFKTVDSGECRSGQCLTSFFGLADPCDEDAGALAGTIVAVLAVLALAGVAAFFAADALIAIGTHLEHPWKHAFVRFLTGLLAMIAFGAYADNEDEDLKGNCASPANFVIAMGVLVWLHSWLLVVVLVTHAVDLSCTKDSSCWDSFVSTLRRVACPLDAVFGFLTLIAICAAAFNHPATNKARGAITALFFTFTLLVLTFLVQFVSGRDAKDDGSLEAKSTPRKGFRRSSAQGDFA